jgi:uncharacterized protein (TIGR00730 family)
MKTVHSASPIKRLCVFCGSSPGIRPVYQEVTKELGHWVANSGIILVYGGARVGLMGVLANSVLAEGGQVVGVMPKALVEKEVAHTTLTHLHIVESMHERKALMADLSDAFLLLPGGFGSWEEFCEIVTWGMMGIHRKHCGILNVAGYYNALLALTSHAVSEGFVPEVDRNSIIVEDNVEQLLSKLNAAPVRVQQKIASREER